MNQQKTKRLMEIDDEIRTLADEIARQEKRLRALNRERDSLLYPDGAVYTYSPSPNQQLSV